MYNTRRRSKTDVCNDVAHAWAHQHGSSDSNSNESFYFKGDTIYSYGSHFPIAKHVAPRTILFTTRTYSNTTAAHIAAVRRAASHLNKIHCDYIPLDEYEYDKAHKKNTRSWVNQIESLVNEANKAKRMVKKVRLEGEIQAVRNEAALYFAHFKIKPSKEDMRILADAPIDELSIAFKKKTEADKRAAAKARKQQERERLERMKVAEDTYNRWLPIWHEGNDDKLYGCFSRNERSLVHDYVDSSGLSFLRVMGDKIETSKSIRIPMAVAHRYYKRYLTVVESGGCSGCGFKMMGYDVNTITADSLIVGCHTILRSEIDHIAAQMGWDKQPTGYTVDDLMADEQNPVN